MTRFFLIFLLLVLLMFAAELTPWVQDAFVIPFTSAIAMLSVGLMGLWDDQVASQGKVIWDSVSGFAVSIEAGCNGVEAGIVLASAMLAFPARWSQKLMGIALGMLTVQALNLARIITLFYLGQWNKTAFEWAHLYIWQALIMLDVLVVASKSERRDALRFPALRPSPRLDGPASRLNGSHAPETVQE